MDGIRLAWTPVDTRSRVVSVVLASDWAAETQLSRTEALWRTTFAFIAGLLPLVFASGSGAIGNRAIGTVAVGGMLLDTSIGFLVVPGF